MGNRPKNLPTLPFDSPTVLTYRKQCQKGREIEDVWSWYVLRRLSIYFAILLSKRNVRPNAVTWISLLGMIAAGYSMAFASPTSFLLAFVFYNIGYMSDCVDGEMARIQERTSRRGYFLDILIQACSIPIFSSIGIALVELHTGQALGALYAAVLYTVIVVATMSLFIPIALQLTQAKTEEVDPVKQIRVKSNFFEWVAFFTGLPGFFFVLLLLAACTLWISLPIVWIKLFFTAFLGIFMAKAAVRLVITLSSIRD